MKDLFDNCNSVCGANDFLRSLAHLLAVLYARVDQGLTSDNVGPRESVETPLTEKQLEIISYYEHFLSCYTSQELYYFKSELSVAMRAIPSIYNANQHIKSAMNPSGCLVANGLFGASGAKKTPPSEIETPVSRSITTQP